MMEENGSMIGKQLIDVLKNVMIIFIDNNSKMTFEEAIRRATIGARQGSDDQQLDPPLVPMCTYVGLAYRYCQEKYKDNPERCNITDDWFTTTSLCRR